MSLLKRILGIDSSLENAVRDACRDLTRIANEVVRCRKEIQVLQKRLGALQASVSKMHAMEALQVMDFAISNHPHFSDPLRLTRYGHQVCSQNGEDGMIIEIFRRIGTTNRRFLEIGVGDNCENNTAFLLSQGWSGCWIDGKQNTLDLDFLKKDPAAPRLVSKTAMVSKENINTLIAELKMPREIDLLCIDIDWNTWHIWDAIEGLSPRVVVVEYNASIPPGIDWGVLYDATATWDGTQNFGASLKAFENLGRKKGYSLVGCDFMGCNAFLVRDDARQENFRAPYTAENHYEPPRYALIHRRGHRNAVPGSAYITHPAEVK